MAESITCAASGAAQIARAQAQATTAAQLRLAGKRAGTRVALSWPSLAGAASYRIVVAQNGGAARMIAAASTRTSASYSLAKGKTYRFTVAALDASGRQLAVSTPWTVSLPRGRR